MERYPYLLEVKEDSYHKRLNVKGFFKAIGKIALTVTIADPASTAVLAGKETIGALNYETSTSHRAFELVLNGLEQACVQLITEHQLTCTQNEALLLQQRLSETTKELEVKISGSFFSAPQDLELLSPLKEIFQYWLEGLTLTSAQAKAISQRLPCAFVVAVMQEWGTKSAYYKCVLEAFDNPFQAVWDAMYHRAVYEEALRQLVYAPALKDAELSLKNLYVKPYFLLNNRSNGYYYKDEFVRPDNYEGNLHDYLLARLIRKVFPLGLNLKQRLIFLLGQPGQGKSSFCAYLMHQLLNDTTFQENLYFVRLRDIEDNVALIQQPFPVLEEHFESEYQLKINWKAPNFLILDGLDELYMSNGLTNKDLRHFYKALERKIKLNTSLTILLTSRHHYLHIEQDVDSRRATLLKLAPFSLAQQKEWLQTYRNVHPSINLTAQKLEEIHEKDCFKPIRELIEQPILLHLIAKANIEIEEEQQLDRARIYQHLFNQLLSRSWAEEQLEKYHQLESTQQAQILFRAWLQEIAFTIYNSNEQYIRVKEILELESTKKLLPYIDTAKNIEDAAKDLLVAFYFKKATAKEEAVLNENQAVEFLHKSLQEYLTVEYYWQEIITKVVKSATPPSDLEIFALFSKLFAKKGLNRNMKVLLYETIEQSNEEDKIILRQRLKQALTMCLQHQFLYQYQAHEEAKDTTPPITRANQCFRSFWFILSRLDVKQNMDLLTAENQAIFMQLLSIFGSEGLLLNYLNLRGAYLRDAYLRGLRI